MEENIKKQVIDFMDGRKLSGGIITQLKKRKYELFKIIEKESKEKGYKRITYFLDEELNHPEHKKCKICGKELSYEQSFVRKIVYCSNRCATQDKELIAIRSNVFKKKYGKDNAEGHSLIMKKKEETSMKHYGTKHPNQNKEQLALIQQTLMNKYGVTNASQIDGVQEKVEQTNLKRFGVKRPQILQSLKDKTKETNIERYGGIAPACNENIKLKMQQTCLDRYGVKNAFQSEEKKKKIRETNKLKYGAEHFQQSEIFLRPIFEKRIEKLSKYMIPLFTFEEYMQFGSGHSYKWKCLKCGKEFEQCYYGNSEKVGSIIIPRCCYCHPIQEFRSDGEKELFSYVTTIYTGTIIENDTTILNGYELDIYIPDKKVAIEFNGLYWHSEEQGKDRNYHLWKTKKCFEKGIHLIHVFEDEWQYNKKYVCNKIQQLLCENNLSIETYQIKKLSTQEGNEFLSKYTLSKNTYSLIYYGFFVNTQLIAVISFNHTKYNKKFQWQLSKYAIIAGYSSELVFKLLFNTFLCDENPLSIIAYINNRYDDGCELKVCDFKKVNDTKPNYFLFKGTKKLSRYDCNQKKLIKQLLGNKYDSNFNGEDNLSLNGWMKIYDCGSSVFIWRK